MVEETFLQHWIFSKFLLPFLLVFFIVFAILEKTKLFGDGKKQLNALTSFVIGLIFVSAVYPKLVVENMILFLTVTLVCVFVVLLLWGFIFGDKEGFKLEKWMKWTLGIVVGAAFIGGVFVLEVSSSLLQLLSKKYLGKKLFSVSPLHLYLQKKGWEEPKIVMRAWLLGFMFAILGLYLAFIK
mgnify:CR=1 FL=1